MNVQIKLMNLDEFEKLVRAKLKYNWEREICRKPTENLITWIQQNGFPQFDRTNLTPFVKNLTGFISIPTIILDIGDNQFYQFISGNEVVLIKKSDVITVS